MSLLLSMTLSGSCIFLFYFILSRIKRDLFPSRWGYRLLKAAMIVYLFPLGYGKVLLFALYQRYFADGAFSSVVIRGGAPAVIITNSQAHRNLLGDIRLTLITMWGFIVFLLISRHFGLYWKNKRTLFRYIDEISYPGQGNTLSGQAVLPDCPHYVRIYTTHLHLPPFSIGMFRPCIVLPDTLTHDQQRIVIQHELIHIKNGDLPVKFFCQLLVILHWFNPLVYLLKNDINTLSELTCDSLLTESMDDVQKRKYGNLLIATAASCSCRFIPYGSGFSSDAEIIKERLRLIMTPVSKKKSKASAVAAAVITALILLCGSLPSFAYQPQQTFICHTKAGDDFYFYHINDYIVYSDNTITIHEKNNDGSCNLMLYSARPCGECEGIIQGSLIQNRFYPVCPH